MRGAVEFASSCSNSVLIYSNAVSNSCCKWWQQIHLKSLFTIKSEVLGAFVSLLLTTTVILIWYDMAHTSVGNKTNCFYLHFSDAPKFIEPTSIYRVSQEECARLLESVPYVKLYWYNPKHLYPKLNTYGDNGQRSLKLWQLLHTYWLPNTY